MKPEEFSILRDVMGSAQLLSTQTVSGEKVIYSPLAVDGNPAVYLEWTERFPHEVSSAMETLKVYQGLPISDPQISTNAALNDAIITGVLIPVQVTGATGEQRI